jgi:hypothetical protein
MIANPTKPLRVGRVGGLKVYTVTLEHYRNNYANSDGSPWGVAERLVGRMKVCEVSVDEHYINVAYDTETDEHILHTVAQTLETLTRYVPATDAGVQALFAVCRFSYYGYEQRIALRTIRNKLWTLFGGHPLLCNYHDHNRELRYIDTPFEIPLDQYGEPVTCFTLTMPLRVSSSVFDDMRLQFVVNIEDNTVETELLVKMLGNPTWILYPTHGQRDLRATICDHCDGGYSDRYLGHISTNAESLFKTRK